MTTVCCMRGPAGWLLVARTPIDKERAHLWVVACQGVEMLRVKTTPANDNRRLW